jgi:hypothetical protein
VDKEFFNKIGERRKLRFMKWYKEHSSKEEEEAAAAVATREIVFCAVWKFPWRFSLSLLLNYVRINTR